MLENRGTHGSYRPPPTPAEQLEMALFVLKDATAENFQEKIKAAEGYILGTKGWLDSNVLVCGELPGNVSALYFEDPGPGLAAEPDTAGQ